MAKNQTTIPPKTIDRKSIYDDIVFTSDLANSLKIIMLLNEYKIQCAYIDSLEKEISVLQTYFDKQVEKALTNG